MTLCASCGTENATGKKFCTECGAPLGLSCPACGAAIAGTERFCGECGTALTDAAAAPAPAAPAAPSAPAEAPASERRLVSVLFADLVGFTTLSESRDPEEVRALLSRYFDTCRRLIELYGGTVEKFIGDAVMAVWGTPTATEDDAERAVRTALDLVAAVSALGQEVGADELRLRAGVLTGEAAVTLGASTEGMVAGDIVNTASRVQSVAAPGTVLAGEATRRASERAIVYESAGSFELKGKEGETELWTALRVVSGRAGDQRSQGLEPPFVGRDRELRQIKDLFHVCADEKRAHLVSVTGIAGIGKSRLAWEFYKYFDGLAQTVYWHRGRCLAYGEGVTYWALADMVRMRCRIAEDDPQQEALGKLHAALEEHVLDPEERAFVEPRLAQLLGLGDHESRDRQDLFAAWRLFFERLSDAYPTVLAFEDMQWADASLLDFVEYLLEWSRDKPLFVVTLARPELSEKRPTWGAGHRNFVSLYLEPLSEPAMSELLAGLVPGLPAQLRDRILARAEGVPLYAVETVRMLLDRDLLVEDGPSYRLVGEVDKLEVPETLHALVAARLDGLSAEERRLVGDASVLGKTFTPAALAALAGIERGALDPLLSGLVRKEVLGLQSDPRSPEHGQYAFLQDLLRQVAYETLPRGERRMKHLAAAELLAAAMSEEEVVEVVASHLVAAYRLDPEAADAVELRTRAQQALQGAGERAASLGALTEAGHYFEQAAELAADPREQATALSRAGESAFGGTAFERAGDLFERAVGLYEQIGDTHAAARASSWLATTEANRGRSEQALERMEQAYAPIAEDEADADVALLLSRLGALHQGVGNTARGVELTERSLDIAEALRLPEVLVRGWLTKARLIWTRRPEEAGGLIELMLRTALAHGLHVHAGMARGDLSNFGFSADRYAESLEHLDEILALARRFGQRGQEWYALSEMSYALTMLGRWDEALARFAEIPDEQLGRLTDLLSVVSGALEIYLNRGEVDEARSLLAHFEELAETPGIDVQVQGCVRAAEAAVRLAEGNLREALSSAEQAVELVSANGIASQDSKLGILHGLEAALTLGDRAKAGELLALVEDGPIGLRPPFLDAVAHRFRARLAGEDPGADREFTAAAATLRELELPFHLAVVLLEHGEWLAARGRADDARPFLAEARETFERLEAKPWLKRTGVAEAGLTAEVPA